jgi:hypothetical protein
MYSTLEHQFSFNKQSIITKVISQEADSKISARKAAMIFSIHVMPNGGKGGKEELQPKSSHPSSVGVWWCGKGKW